MAQADLIAVALQFFRLHRLAAGLCSSTVKLNVGRVNSMEEAMNVARKKDRCFVVQPLDAGNVEKWLRPYPLIGFLFF